MRSAFFKAYQNLLIAELKPDEAQTNAALALDRLSQEVKKKSKPLWVRARTLALALVPFLFQKAEAPLSLYLWGGVGRGKTMLMDLFFEHAPCNKKRRIHFIEFMKETHEALKVLRQAEVLDVIQTYAAQKATEWDLLCLDEFQVSDIADASILGRFFEALLAAGVIVVATSNRAPDDLYLGGLNRERFLPFIDLLKKRAHILSLGKGTDFRRDAMKECVRYYTSENKSFYENWAKLTHSKAQPATIESGGRTLSVPQQAFGCALFHFDELCAQPLGANDYLLLAHTYHTIFIDAIPQLSPAKRNETKRFIHLIDVLYDRRVLLIANAAADPDDLYTADEQTTQSTETFEFERTASRLNEMRQPDYLRGN